MRISRVAQLRSTTTSNLVTCATHVSVHGHDGFARQTVMVSERRLEARSGSNYRRAQRNGWHVCSGTLPFMLKTHEAENWRRFSEPSIKIDFRHVCHTKTTPFTGSDCRRLLIGGRFKGTCAQNEQLFRFSLVLLSFAITAIKILGWTVKASPLFSAAVRRQNNAEIRCRYSV